MNRILPMTCYIRRMKNILWRPTDNDSVLLLSEESGKAYALGTTMSRIWKKLNKFVLVSECLKELDERESTLEQEAFFTIIENLTLANLLEVSKDGVKPSKELLDLKGESNLSDVKVGKENLLVEIAFGVCECSTQQLGIGYHRGVACTGAGTAAQLQSTI